MGGAFDDLIPQKAQANDNPFSDLIPVKEDKPRDYLKDFGRETGIAARGALTGISFPELLMADTIVHGINKATGKNMPTPSQHFQDYLTKLGLPDAANPTEELFKAGYTGAGGGVLAGPAGIIPGASSSVGQDVAKQAGAGPVGQTVAAILAGMSPSAIGALWDTAKAGVSTAANLARPFTEGGRQTVVGRALNTLADNPENASAALQDAEPIVEGSNPTTGTASKDLGLLSAERALREQNPSKFAPLDSANATARNAALDDMEAQAGQGLVNAGKQMLAPEDEALLKLAKNPQDAELAKNLRNAITDKLRVAAFADKQEVNPEPVINTINDILKSPAGKRDAVETAMNWVKEKVIDESDPENLYSVRQDVADAMKGKFDGDKPALKLAKAQLYDVRTALDQVIEQGAPGYRDYLSQYKTLSKPINQIELLQQLRQEAELPIPDPTTGERALSQAKWTNFVKNNSDTLEGTLTPDQFKAVQQIGADMDRGAAINSPLVKPNGSSTLSNLTMSNLIGRLIGNPNSPAMGTLLKPLNWIYSLPEQAQQDLMLEAMKDPKLAARLMQKASAAKIQPLSDALMERAKALGYGGIIGGTVSQAQKG